MLYRRALQICPSYLMARNNLAEALFRQGKVEEADRTFREASVEAVEARKEYPRTWVAAHNVAKLRLDAHNKASTHQVLAKHRNDYPGVSRLISHEAELHHKPEG